MRFRSILLNKCDPSTSTGSTNLGKLWRNQKQIVNLIGTISSSWLFPSMFFLLFVLTCTNGCCQPSNFLLLICCKWPYKLQTSSRCSLDLAASFEALRRKKWGIPATWEEGTEFALPWSSIIYLCDFDIFEYKWWYMIWLWYIHIFIISYISISNIGPYVSAHVVFIQLLFFFVYQLYQGTAWKHLYNQPLWEDDPLWRPFFKMGWNHHLANIFVWHLAPDKPLLTFKLLP